MRWLALIAATLLSGCSFVYSQQNAKDQSSGASTPTTTTASSSAASSGSSGAATSASSSSGGSGTSTGAASSGTGSSGESSTASTGSSGPSATGATGSSSASSAGSGSSSGTAGGSTGGCASWTLVTPTGPAYPSSVAAMATDGSGLFVIEDNYVNALSGLNAGAFAYTASPVRLGSPNYLAIAPSSTGSGSEVAVLDGNGLEILDPPDTNAITQNYGDAPGNLIAVGGFGDNTAGMVVITNTGIHFPGDQTGDTSFPPGTSAAGAVQADLDGNGSPDLAIAAQDSVLEYLSRTGSPTPVPVGNSPLTGIAAGDLNNDGANDLVAISAGDQKVFTLLNLGLQDGALDSPREWPTGGGNPVAVVIADVNGDRNQDLITAESVGADGQIGVWLGLGDGGFLDHQVFTVGQSPTAQPLAVADFDGDSLLDVAYSADNSAGVFVFLGSCPGP